MDWAKGLGIANGTGELERCERKWPRIKSKQT
jgi:hypothetical protein